MDWTPAELARDGFQGFVPLGQLTGVPDSPGVYVVLRVALGAPIFTAGTPARARRGRPAAVPVDALQRKWVDATVVYIGKAGGTGKRTTLRSRLNQYRRHVLGLSVNHHGGRYIWQLADNDELLVAWKVVDEEPALVESRMLEQFRGDHGALPFANLRR